MTPKPPADTRTTDRKHRLEHGNPRLTERDHDPYRSRVKARTPVRCTDCGAVYRAGRWTWQRMTAATPKDFRCPACRRIADDFPAGEVVLSGAFVHGHEDEMLRMIRHLETTEQNEHPLHRVMAVQRNTGDLVITTTDIHLPRRIGHALENAWGGKLSTHYDEDGYFVRVTWERDA